jgi:phosphoglycolate phosphatase-like HAD superfamily hydrolase
MKPIILFDIDRTIFNTDQFRYNYMHKFLSLMHVPAEKFEEGRTSYHNTLEKHTDFLPEDYLKHLSAFFNFPLEKLRHAYYTPDNFTQALFPDTLPALTSLSRSNTLGIFSEGYSSFQITKLKLSGIYDYFVPRYTHIHRRKLDLQIIKSLPHNCTVVDDNPEVISILTGHFGIDPVLLNRNASSSIPGSKTIHSLLDLL